MTDRPTIFISYSHRDEKPWKKLVEDHLRVAERQGVLTVWEDRQIGGGDDWRDEIDDALETADIAVLLISHNFLTSNFIMNHEVSALLERKKRDGLRLYPILVTSCTWQTVDWLERLNIRPLDGRALADFKGNHRHATAAGMAAEVAGLLREDKESAEEHNALRTQTHKLAEQLGVTEEAIGSFLTILDEKHVKGSDLRDKLAEIAKQYLEMQERLEALDRDDPVVRDWIVQAEAAIDAGNYDRADELLADAERIGLSAAHQAAEEANQRFLSVAATRALRGETSLTRLRYLDAAEHFAEAAKLVPASEDRTRAGYLAQQGRALDRGDRTLAAIEAYEGATALDPDRTWSWILLGRLYA
ncbi:MAG: TIR domain-containing protein, partial [Geminicoccaceae bacterium]